MEKFTLDEENFFSEGKIFAISFIILVIVLFCIVNN